MKYKTISLTIISMISLLGACDANDTHTEVLLQSDNVKLLTIESNDLSTPIQTLNDGHYFAEADTYSTDGWKNIVNFEVVNGQIESITFDAVNEQSTTYKRTLSINGEYISDTIDSSDLKWHEQLQLIESYLINDQDYHELLTANTIPTIEGITIDLSPFIELFNTAMTEGPIEIGPYQNGQYFAETEDSNNGMKHTINMLIENGYIIAAHWDTVPTNNLKAANQVLDEEAYSKHWNQQANLLEQHLIEIQDPMQMTFNEQNKTTDVNGVTIEVHQFIELAIKALASGPLLD